MREKTNIKNKPDKLLLTLVVLCVLAVPFFVFSAAGKSINYDEAYSLYAADGGLEAISDKLEKDSGPPLYYLILAAWTGMFGTSAFAARCLSGVFYVLTIAAMFCLGGTLGSGKRTGFFVAFFYLITPQAIWAAQTVRMYSLLGLMAALSTLFFARYFVAQRRSIRDLALYAAAGVLGTFTHYWFFFVMLAHFAAFIVPRYRPGFVRFLAVSAASLVPFCVLWLPVLLAQSASGVTSWMGRPALYDFIYTFPRFYGHVGILLIFLAVVLVVALVRADGWKLGFHGLSSIKRFILQREIPFFLASFAVLLFVPLLVSQVKPVFIKGGDMRIGKQTIATLVPFTALLGIFFARHASRTPAVLACGMLFVVVLTGTACRFASRLQSCGERSDRTTAQYLASIAVDGDAVVFTSLSRLPVEYYLDRLRPGNKIIKTTFPSEIAEHPGWRDVKAMLGRKEKLIVEARGLAERLERRLAGGRLLWFFYGHDTGVNKILKDELDKRFVLKQELSLCGSFYKKVIVYTGR
jgi:hypothetical protein